MEELESHLRELCANDARLRLLEAQWEYDKRLVQQALQTVGNTFPHFSLHDSSHSNSILINITRILGPRTKQLSATDTWLLLEAAYWHDVGMVVSDSALREWWPTEAFKQHLHSLHQSPDSLLSASARLLTSAKDLSCLDDSWPLDIRQALAFVAADFARTRHATRSAEAIRHPAGYSIDSPRTLIPSRLFEWLARICAGHGQERAELSELPWHENGIGTDLCHPKFAAFMLRLGDLLDVDNGRFCPVLLSSIGRIPPSSAAHIAKHAAIDRFYVGPDRIDIEATCICANDSGNAVDTTAYQSYEAVYQWFEWLREELSFLAVNWSSIAPAGIVGAPGIGIIKASMKGYELLPNRTSPAFDIDHDYFLDLTKSNNLFGNPQEAWQRELLTNAVDATLLLIWQTLSPPKRESLARSGDPFLEIQDRTTALPIEIRIESSGDEFGIPAMQRWNVCITDHGCGIGADDLDSLQIIGSSRKNRLRQRQVEKMPDVLRPTGSFGLGFQSVFLDTAEVEIVTSHLATRTSRQLTLARPSTETASPFGKPEGAKNGVYVKQLNHDSDVPFEPGSRISFSVLRPASFGLSQAKDPVLEAPNSKPTLDNWRRQFEQACAGLPIRVLFNGCPLTPDSPQHAFSYFDSGSSMRITFPGGDGQEGSSETVNSLYRGARVTAMQTNTDLLSYSADLYFGRAAEILQVNRTSFTSHGLEVFTRHLHEALRKALDSYITHLREDPNRDLSELQKACLLGAAEYDLKSASTDWRGLPLLGRLGSQAPATLEELFDGSDAILLVGNDTIGPSSPQPRGGNPPVGRTFVLPALGSAQVKKLIASVFKEVCWIDCIGPFVDNRSSRYLDVLSLRKDAKGSERVSEKALEFSLAPPFPGRLHLPCPTRYDALALREPVTVSRNLPSCPAMLAPYVLKGKVLGDLFEVSFEHIERYVEHVQSHAKTKSADASADRKRIVTALEGLVQECDRYFRRQSHLKCAYQLQDILCELKALLLH